MRLLPSGLVDWLGHNWHRSDALASLSEYFPSGHSVHLSDAGLSEYFPVTQSLHAASPVSSLYFPGMQFVQGPAFAPVKPALHSHWLESKLPIGESEFRGHAWHVYVLPPASDDLINKHNTAFFITTRMSYIWTMISKHASGTHLSYIQANMTNAQMFGDNHPSPWQKISDLSKNWRSKKNTALVRKAKFVQICVFFFACHVFVVRLQIFSSFQTFFVLIQAQGAMQDLRWLSSTKNMWLVKKHRGPIKTQISRDNWKSSKMYIHSVYCPFLDDLLSFRGLFRGLMWYRQDKIEIVQKSLIYTTYRPI